MSDPQDMQAEPQTQRESRAGRSLWADGWRRILHDKSAMICLGIIVLYVLMAIGGAVYDYVAERDVRDNIPTFSQTARLDRRNEGPSWDYWLGTDWGGKSVLLKTVLAARVSITVGFMTNILAIPLGMLVGAIAGYYGGWIDDIIVWLYTTLACIPGVIRLIALKYAFQTFQPWGLDLTGLHGIYVALALTSWIGTCRLVRAEVMKIRELDYVLAARAIGTRGFVIQIRHVIPNVTHLGIINFSLGFIGAVKAEVMLSYLGLGVDVGVPSWGNMINSARMDLFQGRWWQLTAAVVAMFFLVLALNIFGDRLRDALDPKLRTA